MKVQSVHNIFSLLGRLVYYDSLGHVCSFVPIFTKGGGEGGGEPVGIYYYTAQTV